MIRFILSFFGGIFSWLTIGAVMAALTVGAIFWMYGRDLPNHEQLAQYAPPTISRIYDAEGRIIDEFAKERRLFVPSGDIPDLVKNAFISAEDKNFWTHKGYDPRGMIAAAIDAARGGRLRGASTITQQVMKNFLLSSDRTAERKIKELILAARVEEALSKDKILELYLNEIYLGQNSYGVAAAAQTYFNKTLDELTVAEAAYLGGLPQQPSYLHPVRNKEEAIRRRNIVLREMHENGYVDRETYDEARVSPLRTVQNDDFDGFGAVLPPRDHFTDEIRRQLSRDFGEDEFFGGGLTIRATVDPELQAEAARALREGLQTYDRERRRWRGTGEVVEAERLDDWQQALAEADVARDVEGWSPGVVLDVSAERAEIGVESTGATAEVPASDLKWARGGLAENLSVGDIVHVTQSDEGWSLRQVPEVEGAFMAMDVDTGRVLAMQGGFSYEHSVFNRATQATRQPGSSFKPFVYAAALDSGFTPATIIVDAPIEVNTPQGVWRPKNSSNRYYGPTPLRTGIERSRNLMTVRLAQEVGMETVADYAERFGVYDKMGPYLANALGSEETTLYKMVAAYAMFANGGERVQPTLVDRVQDRWGNTIYRHDQRRCEDCDDPALPAGRSPRIWSDRERVMDAITAYQLTSMMKGVVERGTAAGAVNLGVPTAGKTGTTNDAKDVWFIGFTSNIVAGCYIGYDQPRSLGSSAYGSSLCGPVFQEFMESAVAKYGGGPFEVPPGGHFINIDRYTGAPLPPSASGEHVVAEYFRDGEQPLFGLMLDGGFAMGSNLPLFAPGESDAGETIRTSDGEVTKIPSRASFGTLSSGGLY